MPYVGDADDWTDGGKGPWKGLPAALVDPVLRILGILTGRTTDAIGPDSRFYPDVDDSLDSVEFVMAIEEESSIVIPDRDAQRMVTVDQLVTYLKDRIET